MNAGPELRVKRAGDYFALSYGHSEVLYIRKAELSPLILKLTELRAQMPEQET